MKKQILGFAMTALAAMTAAVLPASAAGVRVDVPFAFEAGRATLPAGSYVLENISVGGAISVWSVDQNKTVLLSTVPVGSPNEVKPASLVFERLGNAYRLAEVRMAGARAVGIPRTGRQALVAGQESKTVLVEVAMVR
jgi:hypothetical protein